MSIDRTIVITGPKGYLGAQMVSELLSCYNVIGVSRSASSFKVNKQEKNTASGQYHPIDCDLSTVDCEDLSNQLNTVSGEIKAPLVGLVNNAFFGYPSSSLTISKEAVSASAEGIFGIHIRLSLAISKYLISSMQGSIVNITSMYGKVSPKPDMYTKLDLVNPLLYGSYKASLIQASKYLSSMLAPNGIRVNSVSYGPFPSCQVQGTQPLFVNKLAAQTHLNRVGQLSDVAGVIKFLLSDASSYITGTDISVDGGWTAW